MREELEDDETKHIAKMMYNSTERLLTKWSIVPGEVREGKQMKFPIERDNKTKKDNRTKKQTYKREKGNFRRYRDAKNC